MRVVVVDANRPEMEAIRAAAGIISKGGLVAFPTETVYGLGGNALDPIAIERIFRAKGRPSYNPLIAHVADASRARELSSSWSDAAERLAAAFWPGPLTLVVPKRDDIPARLTAGLTTVAIRVPSHPVAAALLRELEAPVAAPSANRFTELSPTQAAHVLKGLSDRVDLVLDAGPAPIGIESTVIDVSGEQPVLLRPGTLQQAEIERVLGGPLLIASNLSGEVPRPAPGMIDRHYSPRARLIVLRSAHELRDVVREELAKSMKAGVLLVERTDADPALDDFGVPAEAADRLELVRLPSDPEGYARELYATLHAFDDSGCDVILVLAVPEDGAWAGVRDRLQRASHQA